MMMKTRATRTALGLIASMAVAGPASAQTYTTDFESGTDGWEGPQGFGGATAITPTGGVGGSAGFQTQFLDFGVAFTNSTNGNFLGDYTAYDAVTISVDVKVDQVGQFLPTVRPFGVELRDFDNLGLEPFTSVYFLLDNITQSSNPGFVTYSVTVDNPASATLPAGWVGYGGFDPVTFEPTLPDGVTFADVLGSVDEIAFSTLQPGFFFTQETFDITLDNVSITFVPTPAGIALLATGGLLAVRRRR